MRCCVFTVMLPDLTPEEAAPLLKRQGYEGVEWCFKHIPDEIRTAPPSFWGNNHCTFVPTLEEAARAKSIAHAHDLAIVGLGTYIDVGDIEAVQDAMQVARQCGAPQIRIGVDKMRAGITYQQAFDNTTLFLSGVESLAKQYQIKGLIEIHHDTITPSASLAYQLVSSFDPDHIGVIYDVGNMVYEGFEHYRLGMELLCSYLAHVHVKNACFNRPQGGGIWQREWSPLEDGVVDWHDLFTALKSIGYEGWISVEDFSQAHSSEEALKLNIEFLAEHWEKAG